MPRDTWWNLPDAKRERVLRAAMAEFGRRGFSAGSLNVVARDAGIAKGSLFQYFDDKLDLFTTTCLAAADAIVSVVMADLHSDGFFPMLYEITDRWLDYFAGHPLERGVALAAGLEIDPVARAAVRRVTNERFVEVLGPLVKQAVDRDEFAPGVIPDDVIAFAVLLLRHLDSAPFVPYLDPVLGLYGRDADDVHAIARRLVAALERAFAAPEEFTS